MAVWHSTTLLPDTVTILSDGVLSAGPGLYVSGIDLSEVADDGGWLITASGIFPTAQGVKVHVQDGGSLDEMCYSGDVGTREYDTSVDGTTLEFVVPPLPIGGPYDLYFESADALLTFTLSASLTINHRDFADTLYRLRGNFPPPRDVGPYYIDNEDGN